MDFETGYIYHIYNRGSNKKRIFFCRDNYLFFLKKVRKELSAHLDFLAYCLIPNHFHFLVQVKDKIGYLANSYNYSSDDLESSDEFNQGDSNQLISKQISNHLAILLRSYTRAINIQENRTGSLFQQKTKAKCLNETAKSKNNYVVTCFNYIHQNPYASNLVTKLEDWEFSSFQDYAKLRNGSFCNQELAYEMINFDREHFIEQAYMLIEEKNLKGIWV
jgi:putative transposase